MKNKIGADECGETSALAFFLTSLVNIYLPVMFYFLQVFLF